MADSGPSAQTRACGNYCIRFLPWMRRRVASGVETGVGVSRRRVRTGQPMVEGRTPLCPSGSPLTAPAPASSSAARLEREPAPAALHRPKARRPPDGAGTDACEPRCPEPSEPPSVRRSCARRAAEGLCSWTSTGRIDPRALRRAPSHRTIVQQNVLFMTPYC